MPRLFPAPNRSPTDAELVASFAYWPNRLYHLKIPDSKAEFTHLPTSPLHHAHTGQKPRTHAHSRPTFCHRVSSIYLAAPLEAHARTQMHTRLSSPLQPHCMGPLHGHA